MLPRLIFYFDLPVLADQLRNRLEERRKSKDEEQVFVPDAIAADIQKAVKMANDNSKLIILLQFCFEIPNIRRFFQ